MSARKPSPDDVLTARDLQEQYGLAPRVAESIVRVDLLIWPRAALCGKCGQPARHEQLQHSCGAVFTHILAGPLAPPTTFAKLYELRPDLVAANAPAPVERVIVERQPIPRHPNVIEQTDEDRRLGGLVYFIQHATGGPIKIGISAEPTMRLQNINMSAHDPRYAYLATEHGGRPRETELHERFAHLRMHGEWFRPAYELLYYIEWLEHA